MHKGSVRTAVLESELSEIRLLLERHTGVLVDASTERLSEAISARLEHCHLSSSQELLERLRASEDDCDALIEQVLEGESQFFSVPEAFDCFRQTALSELPARRAGQAGLSLRIWSAGCSTGEEAYSIAITVCEALAETKNWNVHIVGSDIRREALETAERGLYTQAQLEKLPRAIIQKYFAKVGEHLLVKPRVRNLVTFAPTNLAKPHYIGRFDCIFCMNVLSQFSAAQRGALVHRLHLYLQPGGYLFLGRGEKLPATDANFDTRTMPQYTVYQKPMAQAARAGE